MPLLRDAASNRYRVLVATCLLTFGSYYCFDMPSVLEAQLTFSVIGKASFARAEPAVYYNLFYTVYAWTNMLMSLGAFVTLMSLYSRVIYVFQLSLCLSI